MRIPKVLLAGMLTLALGTASEAGPKHWITHHKRFLTAAVAEAGAFTVQWKGQTRCQQGDHEACMLGYGGYRSRGFDWFSLGMGVAMIGAAEGCWKDNGGKLCYALAYGTPVVQTSFGVHDFLSYRPKRETDEAHERLKHVVLVRP